MSEGTQDELERQRARWWATVSSGDLDGYLALFAEDAVWVTPELDEIVGREAIRAWLEPVFAQFDYELTITVADVRVAGSLGIERARFVSRMTPKPPSVRRLPVTPAPAPEPAPGAEDAMAGQFDPDEAPSDLGAPAPDADQSEPLVGDEAGLTGSPAPDDATDDAGSGVADDGNALGSPPDGDDRDAETAGSPDRGATAEVPTDDHPVDEASVPGEDTAGDESDVVEVVDEPEMVDESEVEAPLVPGGPDAAEDEPHEGRYLMYWRWHDDAGWLVHRYADVTGVG